MNNIAIVYTLWSNLKKTADMEVGEVGFHSNKEVMKKIASYKRCICDINIEHAVDVIIIIGSFIF